MLKNFATMADGESDCFKCSACLKGNTWFLHHIKHRCLYRSARSAGQHMAHVAKLTRWLLVCRRTVWAMSDMRE